MKTSVVFQYKLFILKCNFCFHVNDRFGPTWCVTLYFNRIHFQSWILKDRTQPRKTECEGGHRQVGRNKKLHGGASGRLANGKWRRARGKKGGKGLHTEIPIAELRRVGSVCNSLHAYVPETLPTILQCYEFCLFWTTLVKPPTAKPSTWVQRSAKVFFLGCVTRLWRRRRVTQLRKKTLADLCNKTLLLCPPFFYLSEILKILLTSYVNGS